MKADRPVLPANREDWPPEVDYDGYARTGNPNREMSGNPTHVKHLNRGRKGIPNKINRAFKEALLEAFHVMGGVDRLVHWARRNETEFYKICGRLIPHEVVGPGGQMPQGGYVFVIKGREPQAPAQLLPADQVIDAVVHREETLAAEDDGVGGA